MTIKRYAGDKFVGDSSDTKPNNITSGATFLELDTGEQFFYDGTDWQSVAATGITAGDTIDIDNGTINVALGSLDFSYFDFSLEQGLVEVTDPFLTFISTDIEGEDVVGISQITGIPKIFGIVGDNVGYHTPTSDLHGELGGGDLHSEATDSTAGFMSPADKEKIDQVLFDGDYFDLSIIPPEAKSSKVVENISNRNDISSEDRFEGLRVHVIDATDDSTVDDGGAGYILKEGLSNNDWVKIYEAESLDLEIPVSEGSPGIIQAADGSGGFNETEVLYQQVDGPTDPSNRHLQINEGAFKVTAMDVEVWQDPGAVNNSDEATYFLEKEEDGSRITYELVHRMGASGGEKIIIASHVEE